MSETLWYRIEDYRTAAPLNERDEPSGPGSSEVRVVELVVTRETPKGVWLDYRIVPGFPRRFVRRNARKRWACPTMKEALASFRARKERQLRLLRAQIDHIECALAKANRAFGGAEGLK